MARYIYKYRGYGVTPQEAVQKLEETAFIKIVESNEKELILQGKASTLKRIGEELGWFHTLIRSVPRPKIGANRHPRVKKIK